MKNSQQADLSPTEVTIVGACEQALQKTVHGVTLESAYRQAARYVFIKNLVTGEAEFTEQTVTIARG